MPSHSTILLKSISKEEKSRLEKQIKASVKNLYGFVQKNGAVPHIRRGSTYLQLAPITTNS
ncbi:hypothetical protein PNK_2200 [Candidatus Protochlamydia naegleriophila]|uniref:Uncharacterized protein n=1 Tax=Candidatus Protochlamydia naegleriophila TaxID=389348 RepID=A0A0U5JCS5_9BACT|nr:hypothetical protein PNK_2200 [Candidatus Protochlamydia naegleriophila]